ncbi:MAG: preprotein translocase subunit SecG [Candidatus Bipolaricaulota bacterium]|nr:preprotein translocase subunit SecG [Candidatus Bipolaricaulota bacterium]
MLTIIMRFIFYLSSLGLIGIVLVQMSEHAGLGGAFGAGGSSTVFGREEKTDPKRTATSVLASVFMISSLLLSIF